MRALFLLCAITRVGLKIKRFKMHFRSEHTSAVSVNLRKSPTGLGAFSVSLPTMVVVVAYSLTHAVVFRSNSSAFFIGFLTYFIR